MAKFRDTKTKKYIFWRMSVLVRDKSECQHCGSKDNLQAHHIVEWDDDISLRYDVSNGLTVCASCHFKIHHTGRAPWNTGKKMTDAQRKKLSEAHMGQIPWNKGIPQTDEVKKKLSLKNKGRKLGSMSEERKRKIGEANKETLRKNSEFRKGKTWIKCAETGKRLWIEKGL